MCGVSLSLQTFLLDGNSLEELPAELGSLQRLSYVGLSFNQLNHVPQVLEQLASMEKLCMAGNNLETLTLQNFRLLRVKHIDLRYHSRRIKKELRKKREIRSAATLRTRVTFCPQSCLTGAMHPVTHVSPLMTETKTVEGRAEAEQAARRHGFRKSFACSGSAGCFPFVC